MKSLADIPQENIKLLSFDCLKIKVILMDVAEVEFTYETSEKLSEALQKLSGAKPSENP